MKIFLEFEKLSNKYSGLGQFCYNLGTSLSETDRDNDYIFHLPKSSDLFLDQNRQFANKLRRIFPFSGSNYDVWHCIHQESPYLPINKKTKVVLTIHDLNFLHKDYPDWKKKHKLSKIQIKINRADAITTISEFSANEIKENLKISDKKIFQVIYNGNSLKKFNSKKSAIVPDSEYIFSIGIVNRKKNFKTLVPLLKYNDKLKLVIAGIDNGDYSKEILEYANQLGFEDRVIFSGIISDEEKFHLINNCLAFVFPSLSEGFGLPVVEAMSLGKPVFLSNLTSLPEIGGENAYYWKSFDTDYMLEIFKNGINDYSSNPEKKNLIIKQSDKFSWKNSAEQYLELYKKLHNER